VHRCKVEPIEKALEYFKELKETCTKIIDATDVGEINVEIPDMSTVAGQIASDSCVIRMGLRSIKQATRSLLHLQVRLVAPCKHYLPTRIATCSITASHVHLRWLQVLPLRFCTGSPSSKKTRC